MEVIRSIETSVLTRVTRRNIPEDGILHSHRRENIKSYIALISWVLYLRRNVSPVRYELNLYIPEDVILHSHRREYLKSYILRALENNVPRRIFGPKRGKLLGYSKKLREEELHEFCSFPNIIFQVKEDEMGGAYSNTAR
jgi:hypothetical protein